MSAATDNDDASKDFDEKEISLIDDNRLLSINENYTEEEEEGEDVLTEKLVRNIKPAVKTEVRHLSRPVLRKVSTPTFRLRHQLSSSSQRAVLRGAYRARRQLENVSYWFVQPTTKIRDPIKNQIETDLELSEEYTTRGRSRSSLSLASDRKVVFLQCSLFTPGQDWSQVCTVTVDLRERNVQISSSSTDHSISINIELLLRVKVRVETDGDLLNYIEICGIIRDYNNNARLKLIVHKMLFLNVSLNISLCCSFIFTLMTRILDFLMD